MVDQLGRLGSSTQSLSPAEVAFQMRFEIALQVRFCRGVSGRSPELEERVRTTRRVYTFPILSGRFVGQQCTNECMTECTIPWKLT